MYIWIDLVGRLQVGERLLEGSYIFVGLLLDTVFHSRRASELGVLQHLGNVLITDFALGCNAFLQGGAELFLHALSRDHDA